uniref:PIF-2 n=1 Tax=Lymantria dispar multicapsid nuclear polyhedrosis virus TaxID=10449 RepID=A0A140HQZ0_NPVLD|nr:PIF-2 [Lymantria dispar multiple nucleopolyhedrovirus]QDE14974.1 pif-2 [Lymantria dispar multiple nucleopolyhedrovirus]
MYLLLVVLSVIFLYIIFKPLHGAHARIRDAQAAYDAALDERVDLIADALRRRRYVPMERLPRVNFNTNLGTLNEGELKCMSTPVFVSAFDTPTFDCAHLCDNPTAQYFYVGAGDKFVVGDQLLEQGGYCTTSSVPRNCNRETSVVLQSLNQWTCIAEDPRYFAGPQNMSQVAGRQHAARIAPGQIERNVLFDRLLGAPVDVSRNTFRSHWDELLADGTRRFEMRCDALDDHYNRMFVNPLNPIECLPNVCTKVNYAHPDVRPNFETGECECGDFGVTRVTHMDPNDRASVCVGIVDAFNADALSHEFRVDCISLDTPIDEFDASKPLCPGTAFIQNTDAAYTFTLPGTFPISITGFHEPPHRFYMDTRSRVDYPIYRAVGPSPLAAAAGYTKAGGAYKLQRRRSSSS